MCASDVFESLWESQISSKILLYEFPADLFKYLRSMDFDAKGIKWKLKIWSLGWNQIYFKNVIASTVKMAAKKASLHIYGVR